MRGSVKQDKISKAWFVVFDVGVEPSTGKRKQKKKRGFKTKKDAEAFLNEQLNSVAKGLFFEPSNFTIKDYLEYWLEQIKAQVSPRTYILYSDTCRLRIIPQLGTIKLSKLQPVQAQKFITELNDTGLAANSIAYIHKIFKTALNQAVKWDLIPRNVMDSVDKPRKTKTPIQALDSDQAMRLLDVSKGDIYHSIILTAIYTGMRRGELLGLTWRDVDLENAVIRVRQIAQRLPAQGMVTGEPKTPGSRRTISLPQTVIATLKKEKSRQAEWKLRLGSAFEDRGLVFCTKTGSILDPSNLRKSLKKILQEADLPNIRFHDLRHTHATILLQQGVHPKIVSERLGHSTVSMTLDTYSHVLPNMQQEVIQKLDNALQRK